MTPLFARNTPGDPHEAGTHTADQSPALLPNSPQSGLGVESADAGDVTGR
jgi:hypothetical protein